MAPGTGEGRGFLYYARLSLSHLGRALLVFLRALRLLFRGLALVLLLLILLGLAGYVGLRAVFNEERIRSVFVDQIGDLVQRPVQIDKVLLDPHGFKLRGLRVMEKRAAPGPFLLTSDTVLVTIKLDALLRRRRLEIDQVRLVRPSIQLVRDETGRWSVSDIFTSTRTPRALPHVGLAVPLSLAADLTRIEQGMIQVEDRLRGARYLLEDVDLSVTAFSLDEPFTFSASGAYTTSLGGRTVRSAGTLEGTACLAGLDWGKAYVRAHKLALDVNGVSVRGKGGVTGLPPSEFEFTADLPALGPENWRGLLGRELDLRIPAARWQARAALPGPRLLRVRRLSVSAPPMSASALGVVDFSSATLQAELSVDRLPLDRLGEFYPPWKGPGLKGTLSGSVDAAGPWGRPELLKGSLKVSGAGGRFKDFALEGGDLAVSAAEGLAKLTLSVEGARGSWSSHPFSELSVSAALERDDLKVDRLSLRLLDSRIALKARVRDLADPKEVALSGSIDKVRWEQAQDFLAAVAAKVSTPTAPGASPRPQAWLRNFKYAIPKRVPDTTGHIVIGSVAHQNFTCSNVDLLWDIRGISPSLKRVDGNLRVSLGRGHVADIPAVQASNKFLRIVFLPFIYMHKMNKLSIFSTATAYPKSLDFVLIEGDYGLRQGVATTRQFYVDGPQMAAFADGTADLGKETVDMMILTRLSSYQGKLPEWWEDEQGRPAIAFRVKGDINLPELEPRLSKMAADEIEKSVAEARAKSKKRGSTLRKLRLLGL